MKKTLSIILSICMLLSITAGLNLTAYAGTNNGDCGTGVTWELDTETGELIFSGTGAMGFYTSSTQPWYLYRSYIKTVIINSGVTSVSGYAFQYCYNLKSVSIPDTVTSVSYYAFQYCTSLVSINVDSSNMNYTSEDGVLFNKDKTSLIVYPVDKPETSYTIPDSVTNIGSCAFYYCSSLTSIEIPNSVISIRDSAFGACKGLTSVTIPDSVTNIGGYAFMSCDNLISISIPNSVTSIGDYAFQYCTSLTSIDVASSNTVYSSEDGVLFSKSKTTIVVYPIGKPETSYTIPNGITRIYYDAFENCKNLTSITIPDTVTSIDGHAFAGCTSLTSITIPDGLTTIDEGIFDCCNGLTRITIGNGLTTIGKSAFGDCTSLTDVYYTGTEAQWESISIDTTDNDYLINATKHYNYVPLCDVHTWDGGTVITPANCTSTGVMAYACIVCTEGAKTEIIPMKSHTYSNVVTKATLSKNGKIVPTCSCGETKTATTIYYPKTIALSATVYNYDGKVKTPAVTVKDSKGKVLKKGTDYTVSYASGRKLVGKYAVKLTFKGKYSGTKTLYFTIRPKNTTFSLASGKKAFTAKIKKYTTQTTGYQIQYATNSKFTSAKTVAMKNTTTSKTISKLAGGKKYYVRVRTYKTVKINGKNTNIYSAWSKAKTVTTKK